MITSLGLLLLTEGATIEHGTTFVLCTLPSPQVPRDSMYPIHTAPVYYSYPRSHSPSNGAANPPFEFSGVTIPPRLKNIGRQLSQLSNDFLTTQPDQQDSKSLSKEDWKAPDIPGMGDDPILCPYCDKPLPPSLFAQVAEHSHRHQAPGPSRPTSVPSSAVSDKLVPTPDHKNADKTTSDALSATVRSGDAANHSAVVNTISPADIARWSSLAGVSITIPKPSERSQDIHKAKDAEAKPFPMIPPPPPPNKLTQPPSTSRHNSSDSGSRFGFFRRDSKREEDSDGEGEDRGSGYAKLGEAGSDDEDEVTSGTKEEHDGVKEGDDDVKEVDDDVKDGDDGVKEGDDDVKVEDKASLDVGDQGKNGQAEDEERPELTAKDFGEAPSVDSNSDLKNVMQEILTKVNQMVSSPHLSVH